MRYFLEVRDTGGDWGRTWVTFADERQAEIWGLALTARGALGRWRIAHEAGTPEHTLIDGEAVKR